LKLLEREPSKRLSADEALAHPWIANRDKAVDSDLGAELLVGLRSVRVEDKIASVVGGVHSGKLNMNELDAADRDIVLEHMRSPEDVERVLKHYQMNTNEQNRKAVSGYRPQNQYAQRYGMNGMGRSKYHAPPPVQKPLFMMNQQNQNNENMIHQRSEQIMDKIERFKKAQAQNGNGKAQDLNAYFAEMNVMDAQNGQNAQSDLEYEQNVRRSLSVMERELNSEEKEAELRSMLGVDFEELRDSILNEDGHGDDGMGGAGKYIKHRNSGNPLGIECEADEEFQFSEEIVDALCELGMASKNACVRAVLATDSKGVNQAAEWLLNHQNDKGIDHQVDVL